MVTGEGSDNETVLREISARKPHIAIVDLSLGRDLALRLIEELHIRLPELKILVFTMMDERLYAELCLKAGAHGYIMKSEPTKHLIQAFRKVLDGNIAVSEAISNKLLQTMVSNQPLNFEPLAALSSREIEVFHLLGQGTTPQEVAGKMHRSVKTIHTHIERIKKKLNCSDYRKLLVMASRMSADAFKQKE